MLNLYFVFEALLTRPPEQCCHSLSFYPLRPIQALFSSGTLSLSLFILFSGSGGKISNLTPNPYSHVCLVEYKTGAGNVKARKIFQCVAYVYSPTACKVAAISVMQIYETGYRQFGCTVRSLCLQPKHALG